MILRTLNLSQAGLGASCGGLCRLRNKGGFGRFVLRITDWGSDSVETQWLVGGGIGGSTDGSFRPLSGGVVS
jgi:hypothetical protein